jgi:hypothetical protein
MADRPSQPVPHYEYPDDEISLYEVWNTLVKHRLVIVGVVAIALSLSTAYALYTQSQVQSQFEVDAIIEVGAMPGDQVATTPHIESPQAVVTRLNQVIIPQVMEGITDPVSRPRAAVLNADSGLVRLVASGVANQVAGTEAAIDASIEQLLQQHRRKLATRQAQIDRRLAEAQAELDRVAQANARRTAAMDAARNAITEQSNNSGAQTLNRQLAATLSSIVGAIISRDGSTDISDIRRSMVSLQTASESARSSQIARAIDVNSVQPQTRSASTIIALGGVLGLMLGIFAAFGREFLANAAAQRQALDADSAA